MGILIGLPGVASGKIEAVGFFGTAAAAMKGLRNHRAVTAAGDNGAITIWKDDDGNYRCDRSRYRITQNEEIFKTKVAVEGWVREQLPLIK